MPAPEVSEGQQPEDEQGSATPDSESQEEAANSQQTIEKASSDQGQDATGADASNGPDTQGDTPFVYICPWLCKMHLLLLQSVLAIFVVLLIASTMQHHFLHSMFYTSYGAFSWNSKGSGRPTHVHFMHAMSTVRCPTDQLHVTQVKV